MRAEINKDVDIPLGGGGASPIRQRHPLPQFLLPQPRPPLYGGDSGAHDQIRHTPSLRTVDPHRAASLDYEGLRHQYQLEVQQEIDLCRRIMEEQQQQLLSESECRNNLLLQDICGLRSLQEQQGLQQMMARNQQLLEFHQYNQHQMHQYQENALTTYLRDDFLIQQRQQLLAQQLLQENNSHESYKYEHEDTLGALQARDLPLEYASLATSLRTFPHQYQSSSLDLNARQVPPPTTDSSQDLNGNFLDRSIRRFSNDSPSLHNDSSRQNEENLTRENEKQTGVHYDDIAQRASSDPSQSPRPEINLLSKPPQSISVLGLSENKLPGCSLEPIESESVSYDNSSKVCVQEEQICHSHMDAKTGKSKSVLKSMHDTVVIPISSKRKRKHITAEKVGKKTQKNRQGKNVKGDDKLRIKKRMLTTVAANKRKFSKAADVVFKFRQCSVSESEVETVKTWDKNEPSKSPFISQGMKFNLPQLPIEPEVTELEFTAGILDGKKYLQSKRPVIDFFENIFDSTQNMILKSKKSDKDRWWPSNDSICKEFRQYSVPKDNVNSCTERERNEAQQSENGVPLDENSVESADRRWTKSDEPGVLEKLPHCRLYDDYCTKKNQNDPTPMFCCQTTELFPLEVMVCCSLCSTWRHAQCGGHYMHYSAESVDSRNQVFAPICDQCFIEQEILESNQSIAKRIERQRIEHLRRCNAINAVMRQFAFSKHSGHSKWPLGSVPMSQFRDHARNVQARHEKAEKQWNDMSSRLGDAGISKPSEQERGRTKDLERLLVSIEDAEGAMDRHNMILFLQNDTKRLRPVGFESSRRNIFDPEDDPMCVDLESTAQVENLATETAASTQLIHRCAKDQIDDPGDPHENDGNDKLLPNTRKKCVRQGCRQKSRFDSLFCSDSCGVSVLETNLLQTLKYASKLHPSVLR